MSRIALEGYAQTSLEWIEGVTVATHLCGNCGTKYYTSEISGGRIPAKCPVCGSFVAKGVKYWDENDKFLPIERKDEAVYGFLYLVNEWGYYGPHVGFDPRIPPELNPPGR